jgi:hypothetical protein
VSSSLEDMHSILNGKNFKQWQFLCYFSQG